jgi:hypothetical protein
VLALGDRRVGVQIGPMSLFLIRSMAQRTVGEPDDRRRIVVADG